MGMFGIGKDSVDYIVVGLGNPGDDYADTRHNAGFMALDLIAEDLGARYWKNECGALTASVRRGGEDILLAKPMSFMNTSGGPVKQLMKKYGVPIDRVIVMHDELDIPSGTIRAKFGGGHAGHNGLRSIIDKTGSRDFYRIRIGIGRPPGKMQVADYVLRVPKGDEAGDLQQAMQLASEAVPYLLDNGLEKTQGRFN